MSDPTPSPNLPVIMTAVGGGSGLTAFAAKATVVALEDGTETGPFLTMLQADSTAMRDALPAFANNDWTTTTEAGGSITSKISQGIASATVSMQPLSPQVRQQFNPGDTLSTYLLTLQMSGAVLWGGSTYFVAFNNNVTPQLQTLLLQSLQNIIRQSL